ncbi:hypothetical protein THAOC_17850, partial [Thalassiosira oceanica]
VLGVQRQALPVRRDRLVVPPLLAQDDAQREQRVAVAIVEQLEDPTDLGLGPLEVLPSHEDLGPVLEARGAPGVDRKRPLEVLGGAVEVVFVAQVGASVLETADVLDPVLDQKERAKDEPGPVRDTVAAVPDRAGAERAVPDVHGEDVVPPEVLVECSAACVLRRGRHG